MEGWPIEAYPEAIVTKVYDADSEKRGMVEIDYSGSLESDDEIAGRFIVDAWILHPYGFKPTTEQGQVSIKKTTHPMNQPYGMWVPPRRGEKVLALYCGPNRWFIVGSAPVQGNEHTISDEGDLSTIHRSGASVRLNDRYPGVTGGSGEHTGITGNVSLVGNRTMMLIGSKFLPFGLLGNHAFHSSIEFDLNDETTSDYATKFDNSDPDVTTYYEPWATSASGAPFMSPPDSVLSDQFFMLHQGGGMIKMYPQPSDTNYSGMKIAVGGWTISVGTEYWDVGLQDLDTSTNAHADTQGTAPVAGQILVQNAAGAYMKMDASGNVEIDSKGSIKLGKTANNKVISDADTTDKHIVINAFGIPSYDEPATGHDHGIVAGQSEVLVE